MEHFDLIVVGTGSGNAIPEALGEWRVALVERDVFGGTCLNRGCIPSKMLVYAADLAASAETSSRLGVDLRVDGVDWPAIVKRVFGRIDPISEGGSDYRRNRCPNVTVIDGHAQFVAPKVLEVDGRRLTAPHILLAAGSRPFIPPLPGLAKVPHHTSDTVMRIDAVPERLVILGGGYTAAELAHVWGPLGSDAPFVLRSPVMLRGEAAEVGVRPPGA